MRRIISDELRERLAAMMRASVRKLHEDASADYAMANMFGALDGVRCLDEVIRTYPEASYDALRAELLEIIAEVAREHGNA